MTDIQHINVKIFARENGRNEPLPWERLIPVFHRWIQAKAFPELLIDVADYAHVPSGPGVMLIGHEAFYSLDNRESQPGLLYNRRTTMEGTTAEKLSIAYDAALAAARRLEKEPEFAGKLHFDGSDCEISVNDRLRAPNTEATWNALRPELESFFTSKFGAVPELNWPGPSRELFRVRVQLKSVPASIA